MYSAGTVTQNNQPLPMYNLLQLNEQCQGISVTQAYADSGVGLDSAPLKEIWAARRAAGQEIPVAMTFPGGTHDLWIRYWLAAGGIDPTTECDLIVVPPPQMVANMKVGNMEAFCVGEPWNEQLVNQGIGFTACTTGEIWSNHPEKVLGMRADWVDANPNATRAILMAVMEAQMWCEEAANKDEMAQILSKRQWYNVPVADIAARIKGADQLRQRPRGKPPRSGHALLGREWQRLFPMEVAGQLVHHRKQAVGLLAGRSGYGRPGRSDQPLGPVAGGRRRAWP